MALQQELSRALENGNLNAFKETLQLQVNPRLSLLEPNSKGINIYEQALTSSKDRCGEFIQICFEYGCSPSYINKRKKAAINFAADSRNPENVRIVLEALHDSEDPIIQLDNKYNDLTPLNSLAKNADLSNADAIFECMRLLLDYGASPNIPDDLDNTPLHNVLYNIKVSLEQKQKLIDLLLDQPRINIGEELRNELLKWNPNLKLPQPNGDSHVVDFEVLSEQLRKGNQVQFIRLLERYRGDPCAFIPECIMKGFHKVFDVLHSACDCDINRKSVQFNKTYVEIAVIHGNWYALEKLLQHKKLVLVNDMQLLHIIIGRLDEKPTNSFSDYMKCFLQLVSSGKVNVNETDISGRTPLHYAIRYGHEIAVRELLRHGAYLGTRSKFNELAIQDINATLLRQHFDDCIKSNDKSRGSHDFEIILDYRSLKLPNNLAESLPNEMEPICAMSNSKQLRHLLNHPLISNFISFKKNSILKLFYAHLAITIIFSIIFVTNILLMFSPEGNTVVKSLFLILSWMGIVYFIVCELVKLLRIRLMWPVKRALNLGFIGISVSCNIVSNSHPQMYYGRIIAAFTILLLGIKLTALIGSLPVQFLATRVLMLQEVMSTFLMSCIPYIFLVTSFALSFYILDFYALSEKSFVEAIRKTIVVSTGEYNESDINYRHDPFAKAFFLLFVVFVSIVLMNLLSALAIYDTQAIQALAEVNSLIFATNFIKCYELSLGVSWGRLEFLRFIKIKIPKIPSVVRILPNADDAETISENIHDAEMEPLVNGNASKQVPIIKKPDNKTLKKIMEIIDRRLRENTK